MIHVGQKVRSELYGGRNGVVYAIHGDQQPQTIGSIAGIVSTGGNAEFDIVFDNGTETRKLPESILYGVQWKIYAIIATSAEIERMRAFAAQETARKEAEAKAAAEAFDAEVSHLRGDPQYTALTQTDPNVVMSRGKLASANIRRQLKAAFPLTKFSVKMESYDSVRVRWQDGPTVKEVQAITGSYSGGYFDGMEDLYHYADSPWTRVFGSAKYIFERRTYSAPFLGAAMRTVCDRYGWPRIEVKTWEDGSAYLGDSPESRNRVVMESVEGDES